MKKFLVYINSIDDTQRALVEIIEDEKYNIIMSGDEYHDKIIEKIEGFIEAINYLSIEHEITELKEITPEEELFWKLGFVDDCD